MTAAVSWRCGARRRSIQTCRPVPPARRTGFRLLIRTMIRHASHLGAVTAASFGVQGAATGGCLMTSASLPLPLLPFRKPQTPTMIEQVVRAIAKADGARFEDDSTRFQKLAQAALKPLARPIEAMVDAAEEAVWFDAYLAINSRAAFRKAVRAMIFATIGPTPADDIELELWIPSPPSRHRAADTYQGKLIFRDGGRLRRYRNAQT